MTLVEGINYAGAAFAIAAAGLWFKSASVNMPSDVFIWTEVQQSDDGSIGGYSSSEDLKVLSTALKSQSRWSSYAAACAAVAAVLGAMALAIGGHSN